MNSRRKRDVPTRPSSPCSRGSTSPWSTFTANK